MDGKWFYGDLINSDGFTNPCISHLSDDKVEFVHDEVISETVDEYTGLTDINGKEIYEGDIVRSSVNNLLYEVVYSNFSFQLRKEDMMFKLQQRDHFFLTNVGNIHDNPEMLKKEE